MPEKRDYYDVLGLSKNANAEEVKQAYKRLAKQYHPDVSRETNAEEKFKEIQEAYSVLGDEQKRSSYDQFGHAFEGFQGFQGFRGFEAGPDFDFEDLFSDFGRMGFGSIFKEAFGERERAERGSNIRVDASIGFEEAAFGIEKEIDVERIAKCETCNGTGSKDREKAVCSACNGKGHTKKTNRMAFGVFSIQSTCSNCKGSGQVIKNPCRECNGKGTKRERKMIRVKIPPGVDTGSHLRLKGEGNAGTGGARAGDLFVVIFVEPHEIFKRDEEDVFCEMPISFSEAALGTKIDAPTLYGEAEIKIPPGTQSGTIFKLAGKGVKRLDGRGTGNEFVKVNIETPKNLSRKQKELLEELAKEERLKQKRKGFFEKVFK